MGCEEERRAASRGLGCARDTPASPLPARRAHRSPTAHGRGYVDALAPRRRCHHSWSRMSTLEFHRLAAVTWMTPSQVMVLSIRLRARLSPFTVPWSCMRFTTGFISTSGVPKTASIIGPPPRGWWRSRKPRLATWSTMVRINASQCEAKMEEAEAPVPRRMFRRTGHDQSPKSAGT